MPNFNTHWVVALAAIDQASEGVQVGWEIYKSAARALASEVRDELAEVASVEEATHFVATIRQCVKTTFRGAFGGEIPDADRSEALTQMYNQVTAFSAYCMGACGPDFWTLTQGTADTTGEHHFDLGHYNRTYLQFVRSVERLAGKNGWPAAAPAGLQANVERAYFHGMATHVAADLVIHQLVNRSAGAYNLLPHDWWNEGGSLPWAIWSTHNKVEHYWDTYLRLRYLGDYGPVFGAVDKRNWFTPPHGLPTLDKLLEYLGTDAYLKALQGRVRDALPQVVDAREAADPKASQKREAKVVATAQAIREQLQKTLATNEARFAYERPMHLPQVCADRLLDGSVLPFVYPVVVHKVTGAYPTDTVAEYVKTEAESSAMKDDEGGFTEANKAAYFSSERNTGDSGTSNNYLTYIVCPDLTRLRLYGRDIFYSFAALESFLKRGVSQAQAFVPLLRSAYRKGDPALLGAIRNHWNLDTGIGLKVARGASDTPLEVVARLDFVHVLGPSGGGPAKVHPQGKGRHYLSASPPKDRPHLNWKGSGDTCAQEAAAFDLFTPPEAAGLEAFSEQRDKYADRIRLAAVARKPPLASKVSVAGPTRAFAGTEYQDKFSAAFKAFFEKTKDPPPRRTVLGVLSDLFSGKNEVQVARYAHRLNLEVRAYVSTLGEDQVGMFLHADPKGPKDAMAVGKKKGAVQDWMKKAQMLAHLADGDTDEASGLRVFTTRILTNLEKDKRTDREVEAGKWNNVVDYDAHQKHYGRNFVLSTARTKVLKATGKRNFNGLTDFSVFDDLYPTEQVFFTLYALVRTPTGVHDAFSKKEVSSADAMKEILRIQQIGFMKIVLFFELTDDGASMLTECWVDGEPMRVDS